MQQLMQTLVDRVLEDERADGLLRREDKRPADPTPIRVANQHEHRAKGKPQRPRVEPPHQRDVALEVVLVQRGVSRECVAVVSSKRL